MEFPYNWIIAWFTDDGIRKGVDGSPGKYEEGDVREAGE